MTPPLRQKRDPHHDPPPGLLFVREHAFADYLDVSLGYVDEPRRPGAIDYHCRHVAKMHGGAGCYAQADFSGYLSVESGVEQVFDEHLGRHVIRRRLASDDDVLGFLRAWKPWPGGTPAQAIEEWCRSVQDQEGLQMDERARVARLVRTFLLRVITDAK